MSQEETKEQQQETKEAKELREAQEALDNHQADNVTRLSAIIASFVKYTLDRLPLIVSEWVDRDLSQEEAFDILDAIVTEYEQNDDIQNLYATVDYAISSTFKIRAIVASGIGIARFIIKQHDDWVHEILTEREGLLLEMAKAHRPEVYALLYNRPQLLTFFTNYIIYKLKLK